MLQDDLDRRIRAGEETAFEEFRLRFSKLFYAYFRRRGIPDAAAIELMGNCVTDIPLKVRDHFPEGHTDFNAWVSTLRNHAADNWWRRNFRLETVAINGDLPGIGLDLPDLQESEQSPAVDATAAAVANLD